MQTLRVVVNRHSTHAMDPQACNMLIRRLRTTAAWTAIPILIYTENPAAFQSLNNPAEQVFITANSLAMHNYATMQRLSDCGL
jgi:hypothetical protein